jgi:hypothetical protein
MRSSVIHATLVVSVLAAALVLGAACKGPDSPDNTLTAFSGIASGFNLTHASCTASPPTATCGTDTSSSATVSLTWSAPGATTDTANNKFTYSLNVTKYPATAISSVTIRNGTGAASTLLGTICSSTATCPASATTITGTMAKTNNPGTDTVVYRNLRNRTAYVRVNTTAEATGSMLGNVGPVSP